MKKNHQNIAIVGTGNSVMEVTAALIKSIRERNLHAYLHVFTPGEAKKDATVLWEKDLIGPDVVFHDHMSALHHVDNNIGLTLLMPDMAHEHHRKFIRSFPKGNENKSLYYIANVEHLNRAHHLNSQNFIKKFKINEPISSNFFDIKLKIHKHAPYIHFNLQGFDLNHKKAFTFFQQNNLGKEKKSNRLTKFVCI